MFLVNWQNCKCTHGTKLNTLENSFGLFWDNLYFLWKSSPECYLQSEMKIEPDLRLIDSWNWNCLDSWLIGGWFLRSVLSFFCLAPFSALKVHRHAFTLGCDLRACCCFLFLFYYDYYSIMISLKLKVNYTILVCRVFEPIFTK